MFPTVTGDNHSMNCNHGVAVVADCISKGLTDFDADEAYEVCKGVLTEKSFAPWTLMPAQRLDRFYHEHGYYPALPEGAEETEPYIHSFEKRQPVAVTLGTAYDNWCLSRIAAHVGNDKDAGQCSLYQILHVIHASCLPEASRHRYWLSARISSPGHRRI